MKLLSKVKGRDEDFQPIKPVCVGSTKKRVKELKKLETSSLDFLAKNVISSWYCLPFFSVSQAKLLRKSLLQMIWNDSISYARYVNNAHSHASFCCLS